MKVATSNHGDPGLHIAINWDDNSYSAWLVEEHESNKFEKHWEEWVKVWHGAEWEERKVISHLTSQTAETWKVIQPDDFTEGDMKTATPKSRLRHGMLHRFAFDA